MRWLLVAVLLLLAVPAAAASAGFWYMDAEPCPTPGKGPYRILLEHDLLEGRMEAAVRGNARCHAFAYSVDYVDIPMEQQEDGTWLFASPPWRLHLQQDGGLIRFDDWNDFLASPIVFRPAS